jgi:hypothetical protein
METLFIEGNETTPYVNYDSQNGIFRMGGVAIPEDVRELYGPIKSWLSNFSTTIKPNSTFEFYFEYLNTAATKMIYEMCNLIDKISTVKDGIKIKWFYHRGDSEMFELGEEVLSHFTCKSEIIAVDLH